MTGLNKVYTASGAGKSVDQWLKKQGDKLFGPQDAADFSTPVGDVNWTTALNAGNSPLGDGSMQQFIASGGSTPLFGSVDFMNTGFDLNPAASFVDPTIQAFSAGNQAIDVGSTQDLSSGLQLDTGSIGSVDTSAVDSAIAGSSGADAGAADAASWDNVGDSGSYSDAGFSTGVDAEGNIIEGSGGIPYLGAAMNLAEGNTAGAVGSAIGYYFGGPIGGAVGSAAAPLVNDVGDAAADIAGTVICTELHRQGMMPDHIYEADSAYGALQSQELITGYHFWAKPLVRLMRKSKFVTLCAYAIATPWSKEMAYRMGVLNKGSLVGKLLMLTMYPLCIAIGRIKLNRGMKWQTSI